MQITLSEYSLFLLQGNLNNATQIQCPSVWWQMLVEVFVSVMQMWFFLFLRGDIQNCFMYANTVHGFVIFPGLSSH